MPPAYNAPTNVDAQRYQSAQHAADQSAEESDRAGLRKKHDANVTNVAAKRLHNADLARALGYGH
mgnify:FL=1